MLENLISEKSKNYVLVRTYSAGVWFGKLVEKCKKEVVLEKARMLWAWECKSGISLSEVALYGLKENSRVCSPVKVLLTEVIQIIEPTDEATKNILAFPVYQPK